MKKVIVGIIANINKEKKYLLMSSTNDFGAYTGYYYPSGGHLDVGDDKKTALIREIKEELNLDIVPEGEIAETDGDVAGQTTYWWMCEPIDDSLPIVTDEEEVSEVLWMTKDQILNSKKVWPATKNFFERYIA